MIVEKSGYQAVPFPVHSVKRAHVDGGSVYTSDMDGNPGASPP